MFWVGILVEVIDSDLDEWVTVAFYVLFGVTSFIFLADLVIYMWVFGFKGFVKKKVFVVEVLL